MTAVIAANPKFTFVSSAGVPLANGTVTVYEAGTTTPANTWVDADQAILNENPIELDARGSATIWLDPAASYDFVVKNAASVTQYTIENVRGASAASAVSTTVDRFSGTGAQTAFTLSVSPSSEEPTIVFVDGVYIQKNAYTVSGNILTFAVAPASGTNNIEVNTLDIVDYPNALAELADLVDPSQYGDAAQDYTGAEVFAVKQSSAFAKISLSNLGSWIATVFEAFLQIGVGGVARTLRAKMRDLPVVPEDYEAAGNGTTIDTAACQKWATAITTFNVAGAVKSGSIYKLDDKVDFVISGAGQWFHVDGFGGRFIQNTDNTQPCFEINADGVGNVNNGSFKNMFITLAVGATDPQHVGILITGDDDVMSDWDFSGNRVLYGTAAARVEKLAHTTGFGDEGPVIFSNWDKTFAIANNLNNLVFTTGSGTGNVFSNMRCTTIAADSSHFKFEGSGCVVGDLIFNGSQFGCQDSVTGSSVVEIGADTEYRAQINLSAIQMDANCNRPFKLSGTGSAEYVNFCVQGNNWGGDADLSVGMQPMSRSIVHDRNIDDRKGGVSYITNDVGALSTDIFTLTFENYGGAIVTIKTSGVVGNVGAMESKYTFAVKADGAGATSAQLLESEHLDRSQLTVSFSNLGSGQGKFTLAATSAGVGTSIHSQLEGTGHYWFAGREIIN